jgi:hypothetical protein
MVVAGAASPAGQDHQRRHQQRPDDERVDDDTDGHREGDLPELVQWHKCQHGEPRRQRQARRRDRP